MYYRSVIIFISLCLIGCSVKQAGIDAAGQVQVFGIALYSGVDYREINGDNATEEPCLRGYERSFDRLNLSIGYGHDKKIRRISSRNPATSIFGIAPGMTESEARLLAKQAGLKEISPRIYRGDSIILNFLVNSYSTVFGIVVETTD